MAERVPAVRRYVGRFAPTPNGALHIGSLVAALASFLDARAQGGRWLLRLDDLDQSRVRPEHESRILRQLADFGLEWDGDIRRQSTHAADYAEALDALRQHHEFFWCDCSRRALRAANRSEPADDSASICIGDCRTRKLSPPAALRLDLRSHIATGFVDRWQGWQPAPSRVQHDWILQRRDGLYAYQLTVVVDDLASGVTDVVRGADLLASTHAQIALHRALGERPPLYAHAPLVTESDGSKLAKSRHSVAIGDSTHLRQDLVTALRCLGQPTPVKLDQIQPREILAHAIRHWQPERLTGLRAVSLAGAAAGDAPPR